MCVRDRKSNLHGFVNNTTQQNTEELELKLSNVIILYFFVVSLDEEERRKKFVTFTCQPVTLDNYLIFLRSSNNRANIRYLPSSHGDTRTSLLYNFIRVMCVYEKLCWEWEKPICLSRYFLVLFHFANINFACCVIAQIAFQLINIEKLCFTMPMSKKESGNVMKSHRMVKAINHVGLEREVWVEWELLECEVKN